MSDVKTERSVEKKFKNATLGNETPQKHVSEMDSDELLAFRRRIAIRAYNTMTECQQRAEESCMP